MSRDRDDPTYPGVLARELIAAGLPAFIPEIGRARIFDREMIALFVEGTMNLLKLHGVIEGAMGRTGKNSGLFVGNSAFPVLATQGGFVDPLVKLNDMVEPGQKLAIQRNVFGEVVAEYMSEVAGEVAVLRSDATFEPGNILAMVLFQQAVPQTEESRPEEERYPE
jgi:uncharacterized protein